MADDQSNENENNGNSDSTEGKPDILRMLSDLLSSGEAGVIEVDPVRVEPSAEIRSAAAQLFAFYTALREAGFSDGHAMYLTGNALSGQNGR